MEGLRGFAVFLVFLVHFSTLVEPWISSNLRLLVFTKSLHTVGNTGVDLFFVLSGYLIYGSLLSRRQQFLRFMSRRVERIYPAFSVVFFIYVALSFVFPGENKIPSTVVDGMIYLIKNFLLLPGIFPIEPLITVAWSLSYELFYYLALPPIILLFGLRERSGTWRTRFFLAIAFLTAVYCGLNGGPVRIIMFISGIVLHEAMNNHRVTAPSAALAGFALVAGLLCTLIPLGGSAGEAIKVSILFVTFFTVCLICLQNPSSWLPLSFSWTPLRWLGNMSYSYYLVHGLALKAGFLALSNLAPNASHGPWLFWALLPPMFVFTLLPSAMLFLLVERPFSLAPRIVKTNLVGALPENMTNPLQGLSK